MERLWTSQHILDGSEQEPLPIASNCNTMAEHWARPRSLAFKPLSIVFTGL